MNSKSKQLAFLLLAFVVVYVGFASWSRNTPEQRELPNPAIPLNVPQFFASTGFFGSTRPIESFFAGKGVPIEIKKVSGKNDTYCFVTSFPFSGVNDTILYGFVRNDHGWRLLVSRELPNPVEYKPEDNFVDVISQGKVVFKVGSP